MTLPDGVTYSVQSADKPWVFGISSHLQIDQVHAFILLRSFLYNRGVPASLVEGEGSAEDDIRDLVEAITPFYHHERTHVYRCMIPLFRNRDDESHPIHGVCEEFFKGFVASEQDFVLDIITGYVGKLLTPLPMHLTATVDGAKRAAKQTLRESLYLLELLFWALWSFCPPSPVITSQVISTLYSTNMGRDISEDLELYLADEDSNQIRDDATVFWLLVSLEVLELEQLLSQAASTSLLSSDTIDEGKHYWKDPDTLTKLHQDITSHPSSQFSIIYLAWSLVLTYIISQPNLPSTYMPFIQLITPHNHQDPIPQLMLKTALEPEVGTLELLLKILNESPIFVTTAAWRTGSCVTDPNAVGYRSIIKGAPSPICS